MSKIKKIIGVIVVTMFLSAITLNFGLIRTASANPQCPGWDGNPFCGWTDAYPNGCEIVSFCTSTCVDC
ncbi:MAG: hypothetical protein J7K53_09135 [Bacteroidales bacterium]|nr:hypothetical protein [Bacteroidales bacterium]